MLPLSPVEVAAAASRLCTACGLCCNGVMFHTVRLQPRDSAKALSALGLKLKRKQGQNYILQPCPAFREQRCAIYAARPERCQVFECRQLKRLAAGEITEAMAAETIAVAQRQVATLNQLLAQAGKTDRKRPLSKRCEKIMAEPLVIEADEAAAAVRRQLTQARQALDVFLDQEFRLPREPEPNDAPGTSKAEELVAGDAAPVAN